MDGILFPFVIEDRLGDNYAVTHISAIRVNSGVTAADFFRAPPAPLGAQSGLTSSSSRRTALTCDVRTIMAFVRP